MPVVRKKKKLKRWIQLLKHLGARLNVNSEICISGDWYYLIYNIKDYDSVQFTKII